MILRLLILVLLLIPSFAEAVSFRAAAHNGSLDPSCSVSVPTGTQDGDLLLGVVSVAHSSDTGTIDPPSGWSLVATLRYSADSNVRVALFQKIALSESGSYGFSSGMGSRMGCSVVALYDGINESTPIAQYSNDSYTPWNTTLRAAGLTTTAPATLLFVGSVNDNTVTISPPTSPSTFTEWMEENVTAGTFTYIHYLAVLDWSSSGATGNVDATLSSSRNNKHAMLLELSAPSAGGTTVFHLRRRH
jgi:hypothetical protein